MQLASTERPSFDIIHKCGSKTSNLNGKTISETIARTNKCLKVSQLIAIQPQHWPKVARWPGLQNNFSLKQTHGSPAHARSPQPLSLGFVTNQTPRLGESQHTSQFPSTAGCIVWPNRERERERDGDLADCEASELPSLWYIDVVVCPSWAKMVIQLLIARSSQFLF